MLALAAVVDARCLHIDHPGAGHDLSLFRVAVADHEPFARSVNELGMGVQVGLTFGQQGGGQHLASRKAAQLVQVNGCGVIFRGVRTWLVLASTLAYSSPPVSPGRLVDWSTWRVRRALQQVQHPQLLVITLQLRPRNGGAYGLLRQS